MSLQHILSPIDFSHCSRLAVQTAVRLSKASGARLTLLHSIHEPHVFADDMSFSQTERLMEEHEKEAREQFNQMLDEYHALSTVNYTLVISQELLENAVAAIQAEDPIDLIVMGTHGASGLKSFLFGSKTHWVVKNTDVPVLTVPENFEVNTGFEKIALAADFQDTPIKDTFQPLLNLAEAENAEVHVLHISESDQVGSVKVDEAWKLEHHLAKVNHSFHFRQGTDTEDTILHYLEEKGIHLLTVVKKQRDLPGRLFHRSLTRKLTFHATTPLLILKEAKS